MDIRDYIITDSFVGALSTICKHCARQSCLTCEIFELYLNVGLKEVVIKFESTLEEDSRIVIPDTFAFMTKINHLTEHDIYFAQRDKDEDQYTVTLPSIGCVYHFSVEHMRKKIAENNYIIVPTRDKPPFIDGFTSAPREKQEAQGFLFFLHRFTTLLLFSYNKRRRLHGLP